MLLERGALAASAVTAGWYVARGRRALQRAAPAPEAALALSLMLDQVSFSEGFIHGAASPNEGG
jgi:hypothetical protein